MSKSLTIRTKNEVQAKERERPIVTPVPKDRVDLICLALDKIEQVQNQYAAGCVLIGMELTALKKDLGHGAFMETFSKRIERPRFGYKSAQRFMRVAEQIRMKLATSAGMKLGEALCLALAPSAMGEDQRLELMAKVGQACAGKTMQQLMLDFGGGKKALPPAGGSSDDEAKKDAAFWTAHYTEAWTETVADLTKLAQKKSLGFLNDEKLKELRGELSMVLSLFPKNFPKK